VYAIINDRDRQYMVREGDKILLDRKDLNEGDEVRFETVMSLDGETGNPFVEGAVVSGVVKGEVKGRKIHVYKFRRRKNYRRHTGHRQKFTEVEILKIAPSD